MKPNKFVLTFTVLCLAITSFAQQSIASPQEDQIKFRQSAMMFMRWNMGKIKKNVAKKPETFNRQQVLSAARVIAAIANSNLETLFSANTATGKGWKQTRVKSEYFNEADKVKQNYHEFKLAADKLVQISENGDVSAIKSQFDNLFNSCKGCHKNYREK